MAVLLRQLLCFHDGQVSYETDILDPKRLD